MKYLPVTDLVIIACYMLAMIMTGVYFSRKNRNPDQFTKASGKIPQWAVGSPFNTNMVIVIGTLAIFFGGIFFTLIKNKLKSKT